MRSGFKCIITDCFVCKHPILEGQIKIPIDADGQYRPFMNGPVYSHLNPVDHLPTLMPKGNAELQRLKYDAEFIAHGMTIEELEGTVRAERERAAEIVMTENFWITANRNAQSDEMTRWRQKVTERIRNGD